MADMCCEGAYAHQDKLFAHTHTDRIAPTNKTWSGSIRVGRGAIKQTHSYARACYNLTKTNQPVCLCVCVCICIVHICVLHCYNHRLLRTSLYTTPLAGM